MVSCCHAAALILLFFCGTPSLHDEGFTSTSAIITHTARPLYFVFYDIIFSFYAFIIILSIYLINKLTTADCAKVCVIYDVDVSWNTVCLFKTRLGTNKHRII